MSNDVIGKSPTRFMLAAVSWLVLLDGFTLAGEQQRRAQSVDHEISFNEHIRPILKQNCVLCHGGVKQASGLSFIYQEKAMGPADSGEIVIRPGDPDDSYLIKRVTAEDDDRMPPADHGAALMQHEINLLRRWIAQGAQWEQHWAYVAPQPQSIPEVENSDWCQQPLDYFVLARLEAEGLKPSELSARVNWLRRASIDLVGLPPTQQEIRRFVGDKSPQAYERAVMRLLGSPHFGERWTALWLDLARYADTQGYEKDLNRTIWPYRDWLIRAFNQDLPFDQFTIKQLAGDLLPEPTMDDLVATAFHRNTQNNTEGGTDDEEYRTAAILDRVNTTWQVWQGTTFGCAQCHSHPHAPFENKEYYEFLAFFNNTRDFDRNDDSPQLRVPLDRDLDPAAIGLHRRNARVQRTLHGLVRPLATDSKNWRPLTPDKASSTGSTELRLAQTDGITEVRAGGTITVGSEFTIEFPIPEGCTQLTALRIDSLLKDPKAAAKIPETGFVLSKISASVLVSGEETPRKVKLTAVFCDEPNPLLDPEDSLRDNIDGWAEFARMANDRFAVFLPEQPVELPPESRLRLELLHNKEDGSLSATVIRRSRYGLSSNDAWTQLVKSDDFLRMRAERTEVRQQLDEIPHVTVPVIIEEPEHLARATYRFERGAWIDRTEQVAPGVPHLMPSLPADAPADRLTLARWLVSPENPLTARVMVNRFWEQLFGMGLVETMEDFGPTGTPPSHPELLDYLALEFQRDWSIKNLLKPIVLSATYRQHAQATPELLKKDPRNRLLARGPRTRLTAEMLRDQALFVSGLLSRKQFGPPVMPAQPEGVWQSVYNSEKWETSEGKDRYRRGVYTFWKRTSAYPSFLTFDAPSREVCTVRRITTNTPLQALVTLNDPVFVECAQALAERSLKEGGETPEQRVTWAYTTSVGSPPPDATARELSDLYLQAANLFQQDPPAAEPLGGTPESFAMTVVANVILNLDVVLTK